MCRHLGPALSLQRCGPELRLALIQGGSEGGGTVEIHICFDPSDALVADLWEDDPACLDLVSAIGDGACEGAIQCAQMPELTDGCIPFMGGSICEEDLLPAPVAGISSFCRLIAVSGDCSGFYQGHQRADAAERSDTCSEGLDSDAARWDAENELWEATLPALP